MGYSVLYECGGNVVKRKNRNQFRSILSGARKGILRSPAAPPEWTGSSFLLPWAGGLLRCHSEQAVLCKYTSPMPREKGNAETPTSIGTSSAAWNLGQ